MFNSPIPCLSHHLYRSAFTIVFSWISNAAPFCFQLHFFLIHMFIYDMLHPYTLVRLKHTRGLYFPHHGVISPNTFTSAAPRGSIVGFARLPCFGTLRSVLSAKVALGEPLRLRPGWAGLSTSVEKAKTDRHDKARVGRCSRGFSSP